MDSGGFVLRETRCLREVLFCDMDSRSDFVRSTFGSDGGASCMRGDGSGAGGSGV